MLAVVTGDAARERADARLFLVSLAFLAAAGFLALHALATPDVLVDSPNAGFVVATPVGLLVASLFAAVSALEFDERQSARLMRHATLARALLFVAMGVWAAVSLLAIPPLDGPLPPERARGWLLAFAIPGIVFFAFAAAGYLHLYMRRPAPLLLAVATAYALLAEALLAIAFARNWHASWWEWHLLMLAAFALVAWFARREWRDERFADLYLEKTAGALRPVTVLFADLEGFTEFSARSEPGEVSAMLDTYWDVGVPAIVEHGGEVGKLMGDALMAVFNKQGDQPDHAVCAVRAGLALQAAAREVALRASRLAALPRRREHGRGARRRRRRGRPPRVRGARRRREHGLPPRGPGRRGPGRDRRENVRGLPDGTAVDPLGGLRVKGKEAPVEAYVVVSLPPEG